MSATKWFTRENQDRTIFLVYLIMIAIPMLSPMGLPLPVEEPTIKAYQALENLGKGSVIVLVTDMGFPAWAELGAAEVAVYRHAFDKVRRDGCKVVMLTAYVVDGQILGEKTLTYVDLKGLKYGEDWVQLGYIAGYETVLAAMMSDLKRIAPVDRFGTPTKDIPLLKNINSIKDYDFLYASSFTAIDVYIRQWGELALSSKVPIILNLLSGTVPIAMPYYRAGTMTSYINSTVGGAGYEILLKRPGEGAGLMDAQSMAHWLGIVLIVLVQGLFFVRLATKPREAKEAERK
jgi:hypothetical protein